MSPNIVSIGGDRGIFCPRSEEEKVKEKEEE